jgi:hypothetical protein
MCVIKGLLPLIVSSVLSYRVASKSLCEQSFQHLISVRDIKKKQIEGYFEKLRSQVSALSGVPNFTKK